MLYDDGNRVVLRYRKACWCSMRSFLSLKSLGYGLGKLGGVIRYGLAGEGLVANGGTES